MNTLNFPSLGERNGLPFAKRPPARAPAAWPGQSIVAFQYPKGALRSFPAQTRLGFYELLIGI